MHSDDDCSVLQCQAYINHHPIMVTASHAETLAAPLTAYTEMLTLAASTICRIDWLRSSLEVPNSNLKGLRP